uniref:Uncharacterized protein n=1 Tax=Arundo donax TaxID=35708 RepID=A0A0A9BR03_ARUDO
MINNSGSRTLTPTKSGKNGECVGRKEAYSPQDDVDRVWSGGWLAGHPSTKHTDCLRHPSTIDASRPTQ